MRRAICAIRGTCRKFRDTNDGGITAVGEEVRSQNRGNTKEDFVPPPKYTIPEAVGWTTAFIFTYEYTHRRRRFPACHARQEHGHGHGVEDLSTSYYRGTLTKFQLYLRKCPFAIVKQAIAQPSLATSSVRSIHTQSGAAAASTSTAKSQIRRHTTLTPRKSIDVTPFLAESETIGFCHFPTPRDKLYDKNYETDDEEVVHFDDTISKFDEVRANNKPRDSVAVPLAEKLTGELFSVLGAFKFLNINMNSVNPSSEVGTGTSGSAASTSTPPMTAFELLEKGSELGSSRALYNLGVAYDRKNDQNLAEYYYKRAADSGHPLAAYNVGVFALKDGKTMEGMKFMKYAADNGVPEAKEVLKEFT